MLGSVSLDLSGYTTELCKTFSTNLKSKDDSTRDDAIFATLSLGKQCSDQAAVSCYFKMCICACNSL